MDNTLKFMLFLREKGALELFFSCIEEALPNGYSLNRFVEIIFEEDPADWIECAFSWPDGSTISWYLLDKEWKELLKK